MTPRQIYLEAARRVAEDECEYSCHAITYAFGVGPSCSESDPMVQDYVRVFSPNGEYMGFAGAVQCACEFDTERIVNMRVMMLTLMAVSYKDIKEC